MEWTPHRIEESCKKILEAIATSELGLDHICNADKALPNPSTFYEWKAADEELAKRYAHAREAQQHYCIDSAIVLSTQLVAKRPTHSIDAQSFRAYFDAVKWRASKLAPKVYGDKVDVTSKGEALKTTIVVATSKDKELLDEL